MTPLPQTSRKSGQRAAFQLHVSSWRSFWKRYHQYGDDDSWLCRE
jgi:hypothetical protein